jgi:hypothetical protein
VLFSTAEVPLIVPKNDTEQAHEDYCLAMTSNIVQFCACSYDGKRNVDKNRQALTVFRWRKDPEGYVLSSDRRRIERRGGALIGYDPATVDPPLHRTFANLMQQVTPFDQFVNMAAAFHEQLNDSMRRFLKSLDIEFRRLELTDDPEAPFYRRRFPDVPEAFLAFVSEYGFLGSDRTGADVAAEEINYLIRQRDQLSSVMSVCRALTRRMMLDTSEPPQEIAHIPSLINLVRGTDGEVSVAGPTLRMFFGPGPRGLMQVRYEPESLFAWMWLRAADDFTNGVDWSGPPCLWCFKPMGRGPTSAKGRRAHSHYCSPGCKTNFNRQPAAKREALREKAREYARSQQEA